MLNNLKSIRIKGGYFDSDTTLDLFLKSNTRLSFIFGRNGSGKTSISNALSCIRDNDLLYYENLELIDYSSNRINITEEERKKIYVFNENFIDSNIKFADENGMNTIVMFGEQIELEEELKKNEDIFMELKKNNDTYKELKNKYDDIRNMISPLFYKNEIIELLKSDYGWATREQKIKQLTRKSSVNDTLYESIISIDYKKDINSEREELNKNIKLLSSISSETVKYSNIIFNYCLEDNYPNELQKLLLKKIEKPQLTDREKRIYSMLEQGNQNNIMSAKEYFSNDRSVFCPYCFQNTSNEYKEKLLKEFSTILNEDVETHIKKLESMVLPDIEIDISEYYKLNNDLCISINSEITKINEDIKYINKVILDKKNNIYVPISTTRFSIDSSVKNLNILLGKLKNEIKQYNDKLDNLNKEIERSQELNKIIARNEINNLFEKLNKYNSEKIENDKNISLVIEEATKIKMVISEIKSKKENFSIALNKINTDLEYIFFGKNRLSVSYEGEKYSVLSHEKKVKLSELSSGERNIIALCYFFVQILENTNETNNYSNDFFLLIDDPISSFDFENKIGIYSLLRNKLDKVLKNNENNKMLIFTHELETMLNFSKYQKEFDDKYIKNISYLVLSNKSIKEFVNYDKNIYTRSFNIMYDYVLTPTDESDMYIGNSMRKVIEAFSTFQSKNSIESFSRDELILEYIPESLREYFKNFMYRLVLNGESHLAEQSITYPDGNFYSYISQQEKQITAKNLICFMYFINPIHVKKQLGNDKNKIENVVQWSDELEQEYSN